MSKVKKFKKWKSERMGHPLGVSMGYDAVIELEERVKLLELHAASLAKELSDHGYGDSKNIADYMSALGASSYNQIT